jgi:23S rRNA (cytidine1920-2'-O)/16S rRNA (cytidine1409-2'-O)-methyltransferase
MKKNAKHSKPPTERLDALLVARGLSTDIDKAQRLIWSGEVIVNGDMVDLPSVRCPVTADIRLRRPHRRYATRGGEKVESAIAHFAIEVDGRCALDVGAAGGGFTDCLLAHGANRVYAVDVGRGQLAQRLRLDSRVVDMGGRDVMTLNRDELEPPPTLAVVDVSFRSLSEILPKVLGLLSGEREIVALLKPLHEAGALGIGRSPDIQRTVLDLLLSRFESQGIQVRAVVPSDLPGPGGALEFFLHVASPGLDEAALSEAVAAAIAAGAAALMRRSKPGRSGQRRRKTWRKFRWRRTVE